MMELEQSVFGYSVSGGQTAQARLSLRKFRQACSKLQSIFTSRRELHGILHVVFMKSKLLGQLHFVLRRV